jgi:hypothetical protein
MANVQGLAIATFNDDAGPVGHVPEASTLLLALIAVVGCWGFRHSGSSVMAGS